MSPDLVVISPEGLYCPAGEFHIDPWKPVPRAVITHGHGDHARLGMGSYHVVRGWSAHPAMAAGGTDYHSYEYGQSFRLGDARVSLYSAGHVLGCETSKLRLTRFGTSSAGLPPATYLRVR